MVRSHSIRTLKIITLFNEADVRPRRFKEGFFLLKN